MRYTILLAAILAAGAQATAQQRGAFVSEDRVVVVSPVEKNRSKVVTKDGTRTFEITLENNEVLSIKIDGKDAPRHTGKIEKDHILLFAPGGRQEASIPFRWEVATPAPPPPPGSASGVEARRPAIARTGGRASGAGGATGSTTAQGFATLEPGRRVIGITTTDLHESLAAQFNLSPENVIVVNTVTEGMPAAKAGVQRFDIITKIEGQPPANTIRLREALHAKGEEPVSITVLRGGKEMVLRVQSVPQTEAEVTWTMGAPAQTFGRVEGQPGQWRVETQLSAEQRQRLEEALMRVREVGAQNQQRLAEMQETMTKRMAEVRQNLEQKFSQDGSLDEARKAYEAVVRELQSMNINEQIERAMSDLQRALGEVDIQRELRALPEIRFMGRDDSRDVVIVPSTPAFPAPPAPPAPAANPAQPARPAPAVAPPAAPEDARLRALEQRMERIERLLERIAENRGN